MYSFTIAATLLAPCARGAFVQPGWAELPDQAQDAAMPGWPSRSSAKGAFAPAPLPSGLKAWGAPCTEGSECGTGLCCSSCSADVGSCMCPCENNPTENGPWNGEWPVATCCCATISFHDTCVVQDAKETLMRGGYCNAGVGDQDIDGALRLQHVSKPKVAAAAAAPRGRQARAAASQLLPFGEVCRRWSECESGICATGCDCDNGRLAVPQPCSCNSVTPSAKARSAPGSWGAKTCGSFFVGNHACKQSCAPCSQSQCDALALPDLEAGTEAGSKALRCRYACTSGQREGECSMYPSYWLNSGPAGCASCCNTNFCAVRPVPGADGVALRAAADRAFDAARRLALSAPASGDSGLSRGELRSALFGRYGRRNGLSKELRRLLRIPAPFLRAYEREDLLEGAFGSLDWDSDQFVTKGELRDAVLARWGIGSPGHPAGLRGGWTTGTDKGGEDLWTADSPVQL
eukprot:TRINITY_DN1725_c0_g1_i1.p1 TRINITY_DN1725_c0_g1~~TRINITY_DN1725_c0_g1_i1.p1  ORF type:complete len:462 (+),score=83.28 TRINITY_DN1725_c0_g1_i1:95-1480(+)